MSFWKDGWIMEEIEPEEITSGSAKPGSILGGIKKFFAKKLVLRISMVICAVVFLSAVFYIGRHYYHIFTQRGETRELNELFDQVAQNSQDDDEIITTIGTRATSRGELERLRALERERLLERERIGREIFAEFLEINPDFRGRISIPDLLAPLIYVHSRDNEEYLHKGFDGRSTPMGTIFLDAANDPLLMDNNSVLYGHNMRSGDMFARITRYKNAETFANAPLVVLEGLPEETRWIVFAAHVSEPDWGFTSPAQSQTEFNALLAEIQARNWFITDVEVLETDRILTLVTCDYTYEDMRFVVHARRLRPGETPPESVSATTNPNRKDFTVPRQAALSEVELNNAAIMQRQGTNRIYFHQPIDGAIEWYSGNQRNVQGVFVSQARQITQDSFLASFFLNAERRFYIAADNTEDSEAGIFLFSSPSPSAALTANGRVTPSGVDARYPAFVHQNGALWLHYSVSRNSGVSVYRIRIRNGVASGNPERLRTFHRGAQIRPLGKFVFDDLSVLFWHDLSNGNILGEYIGIDQEIHPEFAEPFTLDFRDVSRATFFGSISGRRLRLAIERGGNIVFTHVDVPELPEIEEEDEEYENEEYDVGEDGEEDEENEEDEATEEEPTGNVAEPRPAPSPRPEPETDEEPAEPDEEDEDYVTDEEPYGEPNDEPNDDDDEPEVLDEPQGDENAPEEAEAPTDAVSADNEED